jgi:NAD(P)-dependent dehydrogenase (short-subunit alcohol dehydrogenase family)
MGMDQRRRVLITGAGSGLGRALAFRYAETGARVACADIRPERAAETARLITAFGVGAMALTVDVGDDSSFIALRDQVLAAWDGVDLVVNNAGVASAGPLLTTPLVDWRWMLDINLMGVVRGCKLFAPVMTEQGAGRIINIASFAGLAGAPGLAAYATAKAGVIALSECMRAELHGSGVGVSVACPSFFQSNLLDSFRSPDPKSRKTVTRLMESSKVSAEQVAERIYAGAERGEFLILPTPDVSRSWRIKRWLPEWYFRRLMRRVANRGTPR